MTLRAKLTLAFAAFAAVPLAAALWPVSSALSRALEAEHAARLDAATHAVEGELARLGSASAAALADLARSDEAEALARDHAAGLSGPAEEAERAATWAAARGLDVLSVAEVDGRVLSSAHLPGRAGDLDPELRELFASEPPGRAVSRLVSRAGPDGVAPVVALLSWSPVAAEGPPIRVAGGRAVGPELAARLAALTGGAISIRDPRGSPLAVAARRHAPRAARGRDSRDPARPAGRAGGAHRGVARVRRARPRARPGPPRLPRRARRRDGGRCGGGAAPRR